MANNNMRRLIIATGGQYELRSVEIIEIIVAHQTNKKPIFQLYCLFIQRYETAFRM